MNYGDGSVTYEFLDCAAPAAPRVHSAYGGDGVGTVEFWPAYLDPESPVSPVTGYEYSTDGTTWVPFSTRTVNAGGDDDDLRTGTVSGLTNDKAYTVAVRAQSASGPSAASAASAPFTPHHYIDGPATATMTAGPSSVTFTWTAPAEDAAKVTGYRAQAFPQEFEGDWEAPGAPVIAQCEAPAGATSCVAAASPGYSYAGYVSTEEGEYQGGDTDAGTTAVIAGPSIPTTLPTADGVLTTSDADGKVVAGEKVTVTGKDFLPGSTVELVVYSTPVKLGSVVVLADGTFTAEVTLPKELANGVHHLVATGVDVNGDVRTLVVEVTVSGGVATAAVAGLASTGVTPAPWLAGGALTLLAGGGLLVAARRRSA
ncbi:hypothetical protein JD78_03844 [Modestobacter roseus]|uniref:Gram-positive cocci surface proteins LPxTG domain-containing protein n=2 Tax=Modestobacter roseus TaxID=1181884 RepID=A0A562IW90_9ACTN|nr:hypothetical protein [Modestobacter roseus]TWH75289.1 hypothetical protein JD78_03844 [Modestobacter roseus]